MKFENGLWWPDSETELLEHGLNYQSDVRNEALKLVTNHKLCLDIGAHVGIASRHFAKYFQQVVGFEPMLDTYWCNLRNVEGIDNIQTINYALSYYEEPLEFEQPRLGNTGYTVPKSSIHREDCDNRAIVLDKLNYKNVGLIKIDVEGFETKVIQGAVDTIKKNSPVIIVEAKGIGDDADMPTRPLILLDSLDYKCHARISNDYIYVRA